MCKASVCSVVLQAIMTMTIAAFLFKWKWLNMQIFDASNSNFSSIASVEPFIFIDIVETFSG